MLSNAFLISFCHFKWRHVQTQIYSFLLLANGLITSVELPVTLYFLFAGTVYSINQCAGWIVLNYSLIQLTIFLMAWTSIERYLFIYHAHLIKQHFTLLHYIPIAVFHIFTPVLYSGLVFVYPCQSNYDVRFYLCGGPCYSLDRAPGFYDWFGNGIFVQLIALSMSVILVVRHLIRRRRMKRMIVSADGRKEWVRKFLSLPFPLRRIRSALAPISQTGDPTAFRRRDLFQCLYSLHDHRSHPDVLQYRTACHYSLELHRLYSVSTVVILTVCLHLIFTRNQGEVHCLAYLPLLSKNSTGKQSSSYHESYF